MAGDEFVRSAGVFMLGITLGEHVLFLRLKHGKAADFFQIAAEAAFAGNDTG
ncbi:hypothetical protein MesoLj113a_15410 [Mesorhizobium sp. 113-1-2]|nr:Uncharacterized protein MLTONO_3473 [Mesorhizobium loti]BCG70383.1 hypothetical protein MesoLj113a_15410 [Mesorhizobium sp. 113-1-2]